MKRETTFSPCRLYRYTLWREWETDQEQHPQGACHAAQDGECSWKFCPQIRDGEPEKTGRHCPMDNPNLYVQFIGLNPSTADETKDDPTIRRCIQFAKDWGYGALCMTNLFAWRDTLPANMKKAPAPIGPDNDHWLLTIAQRAGLVIAAWGNHGNHQYRNVKIKTLLRENGITLHHLRLTGKNQPEHPLYIPANTKPTPLL